MKARLLLAGALLTISAVVLAGAPSPSGVRVEHAWVRWLPAALPMAGYATIVNDSGVPARLAAASSPDYRNVTLMHSRITQGDSTMVTVSGIDVPAHGSVKLAPGGYHLMLLHAIHPIKPGDTVKVTLQFAGGQKLQADFSVLPANSTGPTD